MTHESITDGKRKGELDLVDIISSMLWDECGNDDEKALNSISEEAIRAWENNVRIMLNRNKANVFFSNGIGTMRCERRQIK